jgi:hypothetical protein
VVFFCFFAKVSLKVGEKKEAIAAALWDRNKGLL